MQESLNPWPWGTPEPGVYFGMANEDYHAIPCLNGSLLKKLFKSPSSFYYHSWLNPFKAKSRKSKALNIGTAYHKRILEGKEAFEKAYCLPFTEPTDPNIIKSHTQMKELLGNLGHKCPRKKDEALSLCIKYAPYMTYYDVMVEEWQRDNAGRTEISLNDWQAIEFAAAQIEGDADFYPHFVGGFPEVVIIWDDPHYGVRFKVMIDYLKIKHIIDLKTYSNPASRNIELAVDISAAKYRYLFSAYLYMRGVDFARELVNAGKVFTLGPQPEHFDAWLTVFAESTTQDFRFIFNEKEEFFSPVGWIISQEDPDLHARLEPMLAFTANQFKQQYSQHGVKRWTDSVKFITADLASLVADHFSIPNH